MGQQRSHGRGQGFAYDARLIAFAPCNDRATGGTMLKKVTGNATSDGLYKTVSFTYTTGDIADSAYLGFDLGIRFVGATSSANIDNVSVSTTGPAGPGPVASFTISPIASPQTVGSPITGITLTAKDASNAIATGFTGTVTFGGTGGFTGTSASFTAGVLTGVSVSPTVAGSNLTLTVNDGASHTGSATIATIQTPYAAWTGTGVTFDADSNNDGVDNGMAWLLGAANPSANAFPLLPTIDNISDPDFSTSPTAGMTKPTRIRRPPSRWNTAACCPSGPPRWPVPTSSSPRQMMALVRVLTRCRRKSNAPSLWVVNSSFA